MFLVEDGNLTHAFAAVVTRISTPPCRLGAARPGGSAAHVQGLGNANPPVGHADMEESFREKGAGTAAEASQSVSRATNPLSMSSTLSPALD